jgi:apolipoprotein N-acyltransferase
MVDHSLTAARNRDRLSLLWLAVAGVLFLFTGGRWVIPLAAWLAPLLLLRFVRGQKIVVGFLLAWLTRAAAAVIASHGTVLYPGAVASLLVMCVTLVMTLPYLADRLVTPRLDGFVGTLVFPAAVTTVDYLSSFGPLGSYNSVAYTQYGNLPLMQLAAVTGIWGITFLIAWFAAVANWAWQRGFQWTAVRRGVLLYGVILTLVLLGGGARLAFFAPRAGLVRVAGVSASRTAVAALNRQLPAHTLSALLAGQASPADRAAARSAFTIVDDDLLTRSRQEARAGAKIVAWPETSPTGASVLREDEPAFLARAAALTRQEGIYLDMGLAVMLPGTGTGPFLEDEAVLIDPTGHLAWTYLKTHPAPGEQGLFRPGPGTVPTVATPYGRLANVICFDLDYPALARQAGHAGTDLMLGPSDDWPSVDPQHAQRAAFRAIENGFSLVRESSNGLSTAVDYDGRVLAATDYFHTNQHVLVAYVPEHGTRTIYATIGDLFAWLSAIGLLALIGLAVARARTHSSTVPVPTREPQPTH